MTFEHLSSSLGPQCHHYGVCKKHFRPRSSNKRKVYVSVRFILGRREIFLVLTILNNMLHASSMFVQSSSGSIHLCSNSYSLAHSKIANKHMQFLRGRRERVKKLHVDDVRKMVIQLLYADIYSFYRSTYFYKWFKHIISLIELFIC